MKEYKNIFIFLIGFCFFIQSLYSQTWSPLKRLTWAAGMIGDSKIAADSNNYLHLIYPKWDSLIVTAVDIYYKQSKNRGDSWTGSQRLTWNGASTEPAITVDTNNVLYAVWEYRILPNPSEIYLKKSTDIGTTWSTLSRLTWTPNSSEWPDIAIDSNDYLHIVWCEYYPDSGIYQEDLNSPSRISKETDKGVSGYYEVFYKKSTNGGMTWTSPKRLTWNQQISQLPVVAINSNDHIYITWEDNVHGNYEIYFKKSTDNGITWSALQRLSWNSGESSSPDIGIAANDNMFIVWKDNTPGNNEIFLKRSTNNGNSWEAPYRLTWNSGNSHYPAIDIDNLNRIHVTWSDTTSNNDDIYYKMGINNGTSWGTLKKLTWHSSYEIRPAIAKDSLNGVHIIWEDSRHGNREIYYKNKK